MATSSTLTSPTRQPVGWMMLNKITTVSVNAACPPANEMTAGATPARKTASGSRNHNSAVFVPIPTSRAAPTMKPARVPSMARTASCPVFSALERSTDSAPRITQNECWTPVSLAASTAPQPGGTTQAVVQPDRVRLEVGRDPFPRRDQRPRHTLGLAAKPPLPPAPPLGGRGQLDGAGDERDRVAQLLRTECGVGSSEVTNSLTGPPPVAGSPTGGSGSTGPAMAGSLAGRQGPGR